MWHPTRTMPVATIAEMMRSVDSRIAVAAAVGYWLARKGEIADALGDPWRQAVLGSALGGSTRGSNGHWLGDILSKDCDLAMDWLVANQTDPDSKSRWLSRDLAKTVVESLDREERKLVLARLDAADGIVGTSEVILLLIGGDIELYVQLIGSETLKKHHLDPLVRDPNDAWARLASTALRHGYTEQDILDATLIRGRAWWGSESEMWAGQRQAFAALLNDPDPRIAEIGLASVEYMTEREQDAIRRETQRSVASVRSL